MRTQKQVEERFRLELKEFLDEWGAELELGDDGKPYGMHSSVLNIYIDGIFDKDGKEVSECTYFKY